MLKTKIKLEILETRRRNLGIFTIIITFYFLVLFSRLFYLQIFKQGYFRKIAEENRIQRIYQKASRGRIFDRNNVLLAGNRPSFVVYLTPYLSQNYLAQAQEKLAHLLQVPLQEIQEKIVQVPKDSLEPIKIKEDISRETALNISQQNLKLPGVSIQIEPKRVYPQADVGAHIIGYVGEISRKELQELQIQGYKIGDNLGKTGVEDYYDSILRGEDGQIQIETSAQGRQRSLLKENPSISGNDLILTIDTELQKRVQNALQGVTGAAVVMNPRTGEVLALVSSPTYDPNVFLRPLTRWEFQYLFKNNRRPLFNKVLQAQYAPGSVFKIVTTAAALQEGYVVPTEKLNCEGKYILGRYNQIFKCWKLTGHGEVDLIEAMTQSCDVYFYQIGLRLGITLLANYAKNFGLGSLTGIDLPSEKSGIVPDRTWKKRVIKEAWYDGDTLNMSIGQGYLWVTPLQMASLISSVANEGTVYKPQLVKKIISPQGEIIKYFKPEEIKRIELSKSNWSILKKSLELAVAKGTGRQAFITNLHVAGKTGTAQNPQGMDHAWFACFAPAENPEIALVILVEHGGHGGVVAAPIARKILEEYFKIKEKVSPEVNTEEIAD